MGVTAGDLSRAASLRQRGVGGPAHPRVGGERDIIWNGNRITGGSSPRGRGTPQRDHSHGDQRRFIPAWAGNAGVGTRGWPPTPVHPRVGGERAVLSTDAGGVYGSSPRGRGTRMDQPHDAAPHRFIPAWAGNATSTCATTFPAPVHPRMGGERFGGVGSGAFLAGSSPHGRGTLFLHLIDAP